MAFAATRADAEAALAAFVPRAARLYARDRNWDGGPEDRSNVSGLSPAIRRRLISEPEVIHAVCTRHGFQAAEKFIQEVVWRTYWKGWLEARPSVWHSYRAQVAPLEQQWAGRAAFARAISADTGIDCFDAWVRELESTGYLHNHARMWFASIWIFTLGLPWQLGADFFFRHLLDADPASNTLSWRWVAGLQTVGKHYLARASNIFDNTKGRFDPRGQLNEPAEPLVPDTIPAPRALPELEHIDSVAVSGLFISTEDLSPEIFLPAHLNIVTLAASDRIGGAPSALKRAYVETALNDGVARGTAQWQVPAERLDEATLPAQMCDWARRHSLHQIITPYAPTGPVADMLNAARPLLASAEIKLVQVRRRWDAAAWPHARKGFFQMKEKIPLLLNATGSERG